MRTAFLTFTLLGAAAPAQTFALDRTSPGTLGQPLGLAHAGAPPATSLVLMLSPTAGPTPLSLVSPGDPRCLAVGVEWAGSWPVLPSGNGTGSIAVPLPATPALHGNLLYLQAATIPGTTFLFGSLSNPLTTQLGIAGQAAASPGTLTTARAFAPLIRASGGDLLLAGGGAGTALNVTGLASSERFDARTLQVRPGPPLPGPRALGVAVELTNGRTLVASGIDNALTPLIRCEVYDPVTDTFTPTGSMFTARFGAAGALLPNGEVLVVGGTTTLATTLGTVLGAQRTAEIWNPASGLWRQVAPMNSQRFAPACTALPSGQVLVSGGIAVATIFPLGSVTSCELYNPTTDTWTPAPSMPSSRALHGTNTVSLLNGDVLVTGGLQVNLLLQASNTATAALYDWRANAWRALPAMATPRSLHTATLLPSFRVLVAGGATGTLTVPSPIGTVEEFDPVSRTWRSLPPLVTKRGAHSAAVTSDGMVVLMGGQGGLSNLVLSSVETIRF